MTSFSHLKKQFEEYEASLTPEARAERDRRHEETLAELARQQERILGPYLKMERLLEPYRALEAARDSLGLAGAFGGLDVSTISESIAAQVARATGLEDTAGRALGLELPPGLHSAMEAAQASLGLTDELRRLGVPALTESIAAQVARATGLEDTVGRALGLELPPGLHSAMEAAQASLGLTDELRRLGVPALTESIAAQVVRATGLEDTVQRALGLGLPPGLHSAMEAARASLGLAVPGLSESTAAQLARITAVEDILGRIPGPLLRDAREAPHLLGDSIRHLIEASPMDSMVADLLQREEEMRALLGEWTEPESESQGEPDLQTEAVDEPAEVPAPALPPRTGPSLKQRRLAAYYVLLDDVRREKDGSLILDYLVERLFVLYQAMIRDVDEGRY